MIPFNQIPMNEDARLVPNAGKLFIQVNEKQNMGRQRFSVAHELMHVILASKSEKQHQLSCNGIGNFARKFEEEWLCDLGASQLLLLNKRFLSPYLHQEDAFSLAAISRIQTLFKTSFEATTRALLNSCKWPIAVAFCYPGYKNQDKHLEYQPTLPFMEEYKNKPLLRIVRSYQSPSFPFYIPPNKSIDINSCAYATIGESELLTGLEAHCFDRKEDYLYQVEAKEMMFHKDGNRVTGVFIIFKYKQNPLEIDFRQDQNINS